MADNVTVDNGSGTDYTVSTDDAGASGHVQRVKLVVSADGSASHATVDADGVLVNLGANNDVTVTSGSVTADTELPAAGALADNTANPTAPAVAAHGMVFDGSTWDRAPGTSADGVLVNLGTNNDVTVTGSVTANAGTNLNTSTLALESGGNLAAIATDAAAIEALLTTIDADMSTLAAAVSTEMQVDVVGALPAGTNNIGDVDVLTMPTRAHGWKAYTATIASALTTELNALANGSASSASSAIDNTSTCDTHIDITVTLNTQSFARSVGATVSVYIIYALDGTNYDRTSGSTAELLVVLPYDDATTATQSTRTAIIRPGLFKLFAVNNTGQGLAATGNLVEYRTYKRSAV